MRLEKPGNRLILNIPSCLENYWGLLEGIIVRSGLEGRTPPHGGCPGGGRVGPQTVFLNYSDSSSH